MMENLTDDHELIDEVCPFCGHSPCARQNCNFCKGAGFVDLYDLDPELHVKGEDIIDCEFCDGSGKINYCPKCEKIIED